MLLMLLAILIVSALAGYEVNNFAKLSVTVEKAEYEK